MAPVAKDKSKIKKTKPSTEELEARAVELEAKLKAKKKAAKHPHLEHLDRVGELTKIIEDKSTKGKVRKAALAELDQLRAEGKAINETKPDTVAIDEGIKAKLADRKERVAEIEAALLEVGMTAEPAHQWAALHAREGTPLEEVLALFKGEGKTAEGELDPETDAKVDAIVEKVAKRRKADKDTELVVEIGGEFVAAPVAETPNKVDETAPSADEFATPDEVGPVVEFDGLGRYKIFNPTTGKLKGYTRVTTFIDCLDDKTMLDKWKLRTLLEGIALNSTEVGTESSRGESDPYYVGLVADAVHNRDVGLAKIAKADRKGKLEPGTRGDLEAAVAKEFKGILDNIAHEALELGGAHEAANKGTDLHALCELADLNGFKAVIAKFDAGEITATDLEDVRAYVNTLERLGIKVVEVEQVVVDDELGTAGRLDRIVLFKAPGTARAARMVGDIKTGRIDYGAAKIGMQLDKYANSQGYDPADPKARRDLKLNKSKALLFHLPQGKAECHVYLVDLTLANKGIRLATSVRAWRNEGKRVIDLKADLAEIVVGTVE